MTASTVFASDAGLAPLPKGLFLETSPDLNLLLTPAIVRRERAEPLDPERFVYLEGCVRSEGPFEVPVFPRNGGPLVYVSFGSLGAMDVGLIERMLAVFDRLPARFIVNVGGLRDAYRAVPDNVYLDAWFPQPSVVAKSRPVHPSRRQQQLLRGAALRRAVADHALLLGRTRQCATRGRDGRRRPYRP